MRSDEQHAKKRSARWTRLLLLLLSSLLPGAFAFSQEGEWTLPAGNPASTRFSPLDQITIANVARLQPAFTFETGMLRGHEAAPLVVGGTMYIVGPYPNVLFALDLTRPGAPLKWKFEPKPESAAQGVACCDVVNRGAAYADGRVFFNTLDNQTIAVDAASGTELWRAKLGDIRVGESMTMAPLVVKNKVLVGNSGGEFGVRGWLTALDAATGKIAWRAWSTGPDSDVLIGAQFKPFYPQDRGKDLGVSSWPPEAWKIGGGNAWGWISYDPELDLVYYGTGNPGPWNPEQRPGDNRWTSGLFARRPDTGEAVWFYQFSPHDLHDYDGVNENILIDAEIGGKPRKVLVHPDRNGHVYLIDRASGEVLSANAFVKVTTSSGVDLKTGRLRYEPSKEPKVGKTVREICPTSPGGKDWQPSAYSPRTRLVYIPHQNLCQDSQTSQVSYIAGTPYVGADVKMYPGPGGHRGVFTAWDPIAGKAVWEKQETFPVWSGALATAGDLVFYGTMEGWFKAVDARSGALLWQYKTDSGIIGQPVSYRGPDGKQYVAVLSGVGGWAGAVVSGGLDARDGTAALGFANAMKDLSAATRKGGKLYVFKLPD
ncbi:Methanol dehydrogenase [cytochrome c] subunit 1 precursor [Variovorax sp. PBL-H6]|uniref:methanol/ethanol family PQQ-dependent dehydrogenase n=1 Tax=Variovorax sp. PBL-H6 TaxID=434009 RepID=UPI001319829D|nr:methanol/ethanol family PQQ-dependent dehydrogenase [Variovorax sp. PBL-H6]VTU39330.1 Methanol dehydrogenase [cytochrome c] subunit 1 precursor [Variovorax sp. PBL-H6]